MKRLVWFTIVVLATVALAVVAWEFRSAAWIFFLSLVTAAAFRPPINGLIQRGLPLKLALVLTYFLTVALLTALLIFIAFPLLAELQQLANDLAVGYQQILVVWPDGTPLQQALAEQLPASEAITQALVGEDGTSLIQNTVGLTSGFLDGLGQLAVILVLSLYWTADQARFERLWLSLIPVRHRSRARDIWRDIEAGMGAYIRSEVIQGLLAGILLGLGYWLIGLDYPVLLAIFGAVAWLIPLVGGGTALVPVLIVGFAGGFVAGFVTLFYTVAVFLMLELVVEPALYNRAEFNSFLLVLIMIVMTIPFGLVGLIVAPPLAAAVQILYSHLLQEPRRVTPNEAVPKIVDLQTRLANLQALIAKQGDESALELHSLADRLTDLVTEAMQITDVDDPSEESRPAVAAVQQP